MTSICLLQSLEICCQDNLEYYVRTVHLKNVQTKYSAQSRFPYTFCFNPCDFRNPILISRNSNTTGPTFSTCVSAETRTCGPSGNESDAGHIVLHIEKIGPVFGFLRSQGLKRIWISWGDFLGVRKTSSEHFSSVLCTYVSLRLNTH